MKDLWGDEVVGDSNKEMPLGIKVFFGIIIWIGCGIINCVCFHQANGYINGWMILLGLLTGPLGTFIIMFTHFLGMIGPFLDTKYFEVTK